MHRKCVTVRRLFAWGILTCLFTQPVQAKTDETFALPPITLPRFDETNLDIQIDGRLDEPLWSTLPVYDHMRVIQPDTLDEVPFETRIRFFYTERGLYVGVWNEQPQETQVARLSPRDQFVSRDGVSMTLDPSGDGLYAYWFGINLGDAISDGTVLPERQFRNEWDGAWRGATTAAADGWSAEYFLPWTMMTMPDLPGEKRRLGFYLSRRVSHLGERWAWPALPESGNVFLSALQILETDNIKPRQQFTFYPFASSTYNVIESEDDYKTGFDVYWRPSSNLQLTATINPDFGNVESDDVIVNLTSFETFFPEKRPFFLEGQEIFNTTPRSNIRRSSRGTPTVLVHTRRIGGPPIVPDIDDLELTGVEENQPTELHGAAKVTGQSGNWRYGVLAAIEDDTKIEGTVNDAEVDFIQDGRDFGAARFLYETTDGSSRKGLGWITTMVDHPSMDALVHGIDAHYLSDGGRWNIDAQFLYSDVDDVSGTGGFFDIDYTPERGKQHKFSFDYFDEDIDINDFGFLRRNDAISARYTYKRTESDLERFKERQTDFVASQQYNTDGRVVRSGIFFEQEYKSDNNNFFFWEANYFPSRWDDLNSEGNGSFRIDRRRESGFFFGTDRSKPLQVGFGYFFEDEEIGGQNRSIETELNWRPSDRLSLAMTVFYRERTDWLIHTSGRDFTTYEAEVWQPRVELDYFFTAKQQFRLSMQWVGIKAFESNRYQVPIGDGDLIRLPPDPSDDRDFSISRLVFQARYRWEIAPLSDLFLVYTRGSDLPSNPDDEFPDLLRGSWTDRVVDVFVVKLRYRLGR